MRKAIGAFGRAWGSRKPLVEDGGLPPGILWVLAAVGAFSVANLYYAQPLLDLMAKDFGVSELKADLVATLTQAGYAAGLFFIVPLGDRIPLRKTILANCSVLAASLVAIALATSIHAAIAFSFISGMAAVLPQIVLPIAARFSEPENKGRNVGIVVSGILFGVLGARVVSGLVGHALGWRAIYYGAAALMLASAAVLSAAVPDMKPNFHGSYRALMASMLRLPRKYPILIAYSLRGGFCFGSFLAMWSALAFKMARPPFYASSNIVGLLGLAGIAGAVAAMFLGKQVRRFGVHRFSQAGGILQLAAWGIFLAWQDSYAGIILGIVVLDIGTQCLQISNQTSVFSIDQGSASRLNTIYMTVYFIIGALGTFLAGFAWPHFAWPGVVAVGTAFSAGTLAITQAGGK